MSAPLKRIDVIDPLANERAFTEQVLVNIGNGARVRIDAGVTPAQCAHTATGSLPGRLTATRG